MADPPAMPAWMAYIVAMVINGKVAIVEASKRSGVIVMASVAAAAASIVVVAAVAKWRRRNLIGEQVETRLRGVQDVLADCYRKIGEIERELPDASAYSASDTGVPRRDTTMRLRLNGNPVAGN